MKINKKKFLNKKTDFSLLNELKDDLIEELKRYRKKPLIKTKPYKELVQSVEGIVNRIQLKNYEIDHTPTNEIVFGGRSPSHKTGYRTNLEILLENSSLTKELTFNGNCYIHEGDKIKAYIFAGEEKKVKVPRTFSKQERTIYLPRKLGKKETAIYIEKRKCGKVKETYYSADYNLSRFL